MTNLWWGYLGVGYIVATIFSVFFTKMVVFRPLSNRCKIKINSSKIVMFLPLPWVHVIVFLVNVDDEIIYNDLDIVFSIKHGALLLVSGLIWPISLGILLLEAYIRIFGKQPPNIKIMIEFRK